MAKSPVKYGEPGRIRTCDQQLRRLCSSQGFPSDLPTDRALTPWASQGQVGNTCGAFFTRPATGGAW